MDNKKNKIDLAGFSICSIALMLAFYSVHDCKIVSINTDAQISTHTQNVFDLHPKYFTFGYNSTVTGDLDCPGGA